MYLCSFCKYHLFLLLREYLFPYLLNRLLLCLVLFHLSFILFLFTLLLFVLFPELSLPIVFVFWVILSILYDLLTFGEFIGLFVLNTDLAQLV